MTGTTVIAFSSGTNDLILGIAAGVLVLFALVVSMVVPRRWPQFPGRSLSLFMVITVALVAGMLAAVEIFGEAHHFGESAEAAGTAAATSPATTSSATTESTGSTATETGQTATGETQAGGAPSGDPAAGKQLFASEGCAGCHTLQEAGASGTVGPNLDEGLKGKTADYIDTSIVDPNAEVTPGFPPGVMPQDYGQKLSDSQVADLVAFLDQAANG